MGPGMSNCPMSTRPSCADFVPSTRRCAPRLIVSLAVADQIGVVTPERALELVQEVRQFLFVELLPHEQAEDSELYPALARVLGGDDTTGTMSRGHAEIAHLTHRLGRVLDDIDNHRLEGEDATDVLRLLYGLHAVLTLHFSQEDESYLSLADT